jgi:hypothetical protein
MGGDDAASNPPDESLPGVLRIASVTARSVPGNALSFFSSQPNVYLKVRSGWRTRRARRSSAAGRRDDDGTADYLPVAEAVPAGASKTAGLHLSQWDVLPDAKRADGTGDVAWRKTDCVRLAFPFPLGVGAMASLPVEALRARANDSDRRPELAVELWQKNLTYDTRICEPYVVDVRPWLARSRQDAHGFALRTESYDPGDGRPRLEFLVQIEKPPGVRWAGDGAGAEMDRDAAPEPGEGAWENPLLWGPLCCAPCEAWAIAEFEDVNKNNSRDISTVFFTILTAFGWRGSGHCFSSADACVGNALALVLFSPFAIAGTALVTPLIIVRNCCLSPRAWFASLSLLLISIATFQWIGFLVECCRGCCCEDSYLTPEERERKRRLETEAGDLEAGAGRGGDEGAALVDAGAAE